MQKKIPIAKLAIGFFYLVIDKTLYFITPAGA